ncbi:serine/threonine protein kinase [Salmonella enterica subsp. salamae]|nr:serine/threonine protein kinase [Salmonella enterica subsp. salamae serovar Sofia]
MKYDSVTGVYQVSIDVAHPLLLFPLPFWVRSGLSWHYPNYPKNRKTALRPRHDWL